MSARPRLHILQVSAYGPNNVGGLEKVVRALCIHLVKEHEVTWCTSETLLAQDVPGVRYLPMRTWDPLGRFAGITFPLWSIGSLLALKRAVRESSVIHVHESLCVGCIAALWFGKWYGKKTVITSHTVLYGRFRVPGLTWIMNACKWCLAFAAFPWADVVTAVGENLSDSLKRTFGVRAKVITNGIDTEIFRAPSASERQACRAELGMKPDDFVCLFTGRFVVEKGLPVIRSLAEHFPTWTWILIGNGLIDPRAWNLRNVRVVDPVSDERTLARFYQASDAFVFASEKEGGSLAVSEALSCGVPVLLSRSLKKMGIESDGIIEVDAGLEQWKKALQALHDMPVSDRERRFPAVDKNRHSWEKITSAYLELYA